MSAERQHERYEELAASAAIGELSAPEFEELQEHLASCNACRAVCSDFARIAATDLGLLAVKNGGPIWNAGTEQVDEAELLASIRAKAMGPAASIVEPANTSVSGKEAMSRPRLNLRHLFPKIGYAAAGVTLAVCLGSLGYWVHRRQSQPTIAQYESELGVLREESKVAQSSRRSVDDALVASETQLREVAGKLQQAETEQARLVEENEQLQKRMALVTAAAQEVQDELKTSESRRDIEVRVRNQLQQELLAAKDRLDGQNQTVAELRAKLENMEVSKSVVQTTAIGGESDARRLFGARDLHIVDVYDVDNKGRTKRTYGRVYYVERKLLVFYAFDLENKKGKREAVGFQAWGYRETGEEKPENLGLFRLDDPTANRWVLQVNNPHILEKIDAVYVTAEPSDGSPAPRGRKLLYANLVSPPNHP